MSLLTIKNLTVTLPPGRAARPILDRISLSVAEGETVGLVGESGSGKSVTSRSALGLFPGDAQVTGSVRIGGQDVLAMDKAALRKLRGSTAAMIFQDPRASINPLHRIGDFLTESLRTTGRRSRREAEARAGELLESVGLADPDRALRQWPHEFSGGMLQRVMIAAALTRDPRLLLADEPTTALDVSIQAEVIALLTRLRQERGMGMLFVTHDLDLAGAICDRIYVMYAGQIMETQHTAGLFQTPRHPYTAALLESRPRLASPAHRLDAVAGRQLSLGESTTGCPFQPRCGHAMPQCQASRIPLNPYDDGQGEGGTGAHAACLRAEEVTR